MAATSGCRTTSRTVNRFTPMPATPSSVSSASRSPLRWPGGRSICVRSPVITMRVPSPIRVRNIFICAGVVFCASSRITNACARVRPRMNASGATSISPVPIRRVTWSPGIMSPSASYNGRRYGSTFSLRSPGRKPSRSPASTAGRDSTMRSTRPACSMATACATARYVLPVPAGPMPNTISCRASMSM